jgi:hypothetical protein
MRRDRVCRTKILGSEEERSSLSPTFIVIYMTGRIIHLLGPVESCKSIDVDDWKARYTLNENKNRVVLKMIRIVEAWHVVQHAARI